MLTQEKLKSVLSYSPDTGYFTWLITSGKAVKGHIAGSMNDAGYIRIFIDGQGYRAHRLAWLYMTGEWPENDVDHKDRVRSNNVFSNLRPATKLQNGQNQSQHITNSSGTTGVYYIQARGKWRASIISNGKRIHLGVFLTQGEAIAARLKAKAQLHTFNPTQAGANNGN